MKKFRTKTFRWKKSNITYVNRKERKYQPKILQNPVFELFSITYKNDLF